MKRCFDEKVLECWEFTNRNWVNFEFWEIGDIGNWSV